MGRTIPSTTARVDERLAEWQFFARVLPRSGQEAFQDLAVAARNARAAISEAPDPDIAIPILLAMLVQVQRDLRQAEARIQSSLGKG
ncbi:MAG: hypothetical protein HY520_01550 [Candidatus Aenigmarchaeota archaeon]|nr:hypothetical protein [Candidatus Aenigmarchaeota archaeon]